MTNELTPTLPAYRTYTVVGCYTEAVDWPVGFVEYVTAKAAWQAEERALADRSDDAIVISVFEGRVEQALGVTPIDTTEEGA
jgi:hypothetical protein